MKSTEKNKNIDQALKDIFNIDRKVVIENKKCALNCDEPDFNFKDNLSKKEYSISGICQKCQNKIFGD